MDMSQAVASRMERLSRDVRRYGPRDDPALLRFHTEIFGALARQSDPQRFHWLYEENPHNGTEGPNVWLCKKNGEVVGEQAGIPHRLQVGGTECRGLWAVDLAVRPAWRLRGVGPALSDCQIRHHDLTVAIGATDPAYRAYLRAGWHDLGRADCYVRPFDPVAVLGWRPPLQRLVALAARLAAALALPGLRLLAAGFALFYRLRGYRFEKVASFDRRVNKIWNVTAGQCPPSVIARRDYESLRWRFDQPPDAGRYERFYLSHRGVVRGYAVLRLGSLHDTPVGFLVDYLCPRGEEKALFSASAEWLRRAGVAAMVCDLLVPRASRSLRAQAFLPVQRHDAHRILFKPGPESSLDLSLLKQRESWFLTRADSDWDHQDM